MLQRYFTNHVRSGKPYFNDIEIVRAEDIRKEIKKLQEFIEYNNFDKFELIIEIEKRLSINMKIT